MNCRSTKSDRRIETGQDVDPTHYFLRKRERPFHLDCVLIPESWTSRLRSLEVENFEDCATTITGPWSSRLTFQLGASAAPNPASSEAAILLQNFSKTEVECCRFTSACVESIKDGKCL